ncbi:MAG: M4 family metallopeptidase [Taibaiella sp.]|jgi:Zn-dependent metalloprotease
MNKLIIKALIVSAGIIACHTDASAQKYKSGAAYSGIVLPVKNGTVAADIKGKALSKNDVVQNLNAMLGLSAEHTFKQTRETTDKLSITHTSMQQYYQGVKVEGGMVLVHSKDGQVNYINGKIAQLGTLSIQPVLKERDAFNNAQKSMLVKKTIRQYPVELVIASVPSSSVHKDYALAYKARVDGKTAKGNMVMANVFVDAVTGKILKTIDLMADADVTGTANTLYSGIRPLTIDSFAGGYRLRDNGRNIQTYNGGEAGDSLGNVNWNIDYVNNNAHWDLFNTLSSVTLQTASPALIAGTNVDRIVFFNISETAPQTEYGQNARYVGVFGQSSLPAVNDGLRNILDPAKSYYGTYINLEIDTVQYTFNTTSSASYSLANISAGTHPWADTAGNSGSYTISMQKNPAVDVHWGMEKTHDFYSNVMSRNSYNDSGSVIRNYVNAGLPNNAGAYPEPYNFMVYGMGDGYSNNPFVSIDLIGHEFTHMVTGHTADLEYQGESGALNESFSDIFGTSIEFYAKGADANWIMGEGIKLDSPGFFRSMAQPKLAQNPDTYEGEYWKSPDSAYDNGGVHFNSGVQNKWFYLLSQGGSGTNDKGDAYTVTGIGIAKAQQIAYRNLTNYLTPQSQYIDAYTGSLQATKDLYGNDTTKQEYRSLREAWYAVGIGEKPAPPTAVNEIMVNNDDLKIYPNPATGSVTISSALNQTLDAQIINVVGIPVMNITVSKGLNPVDISTLAKGVYMIRYNTGVKGYVQKLSVL